MAVKPRAITLPYQIPVVWSPQAAYAIQKDFETLVQALQAAGIGVVLPSTSTLGPPGPRGVPGLSIPGLDGDEGEMGVGLPGMPGPPGAAGTPGASGTGTPGVSGMEGQDGQDGQDSLIPGPPGATGATGAAGTPGAAGGGGVVHPYMPADEPDVGDPEAYLSALGGGNLQTTVVANSTVFSTFNPQGLLAANIGQICGDASHLRTYIKLANQAGKTGWYPYTLLGGMPGPTPWGCWLSGTQAIVGVPRTNGYGYWMGGVGDGESQILGSISGATAEVYIGGKRYHSMATAATSGQLATLNTNTTNPRKVLDDDIDVWIDMVTDPSAVTTVRYSFGISSAALTDTETPGSASNGSLMLRFSTAAGDGGWVGTTQLNGALNQTVSATIASIAANTAYRLRVRFVRSGTPTVYFSVNDGPETAMTTNIPLTGSTYFLVFGVVTKANAARAFVWRSAGGSVGS